MRELIIALYEDQRKLKHGVREGFITPIEAIAEYKVLIQQFNITAKEIGIG